MDVWTNEPLRLLKIFKEFGLQYIRELKHVSSSFQIITKISFGLGKY